MQALPFVIALATARALAPLLIPGLGGVPVLRREGPHGRALPFPLGVLVVLAALLALIPVALFERLEIADVYPDDLALVMLFVPGVALIGLLADTLALSAVGTTEGDAAGITVRALLLAAAVGLALLTASYVPGSEDDFLVAAALLVLAVHVFGVLNARPGRSAKALILLGVGLLVATWDAGPLGTIGVFAGPVLVAAWYDLRGRGLLGASGASVIGALAGLWMVLALSPGEQLVAVLLLGALAVFDWARSISVAVETLPGLRHLDSLGRPG